MNLKLKQGNVLEDIKTYPEYMYDTIISDPPYNLNSKWKICPDTGKYIMTKSSDFMGKWEGLNHDDLDVMFREFYRILKHGGFCVLFGLSRQANPFYYYALKNGFVQIENMYWANLCVSEDTEVCTKMGWMNLKDIEKTHFKGEIAIYDANKNQIRWETPKRFTAFKNKHACYSIRSDNTDQIVTGNHRVAIERAGKIILQEAKTIRGKVSIPILESLFDMSNDISNNSSVSSSKIKNMFTGMSKITKKHQQPKRTSPISYHGMSNMWEKIKNRTKSLFKKRRKTPLLFQTMFWCGSWKNGKGYKKTANVTRTKITNIKTSFQRKSSNVERRYYIFQKTWKLQINKICKMSRTPKFNGSKRWLCNGTQNDRCKPHGKIIIKNRSCTSFKSQSTRQQYIQSLGVCDKFGTQKFRRWTTNQTTLAKIEKIHYDGRVYCPTTSTGYFIARRNGKIFITGNSNFPKSVDVSLSLDKRLGNEREVIGIKKGAHDIRGNALMEANTPDIKKENNIIDIQKTKSISEIGQMFEGYKYSQAPLKKVFELIMIFMKPPKVSVIDDIITGDKDTTPSCLNIDSGRVPMEESEKFSNVQGKRDTAAVLNDKQSGLNKEGLVIESHPLGRFPPNVFIDKEMEKYLGPDVSKILHTCEDSEVFYEPVVGQSERNAGLDMYIADLSDNDIKIIKEKLKL